MKALLFATLSLSLSVTACAQPKIDCTAGRGGFAARYTLVAGSKQGEGACNTKKGEIVGVQKYNPARADEKDEPDLGRAILALEASTLGDLAAAEEGEGMAVDRSGIASLGDFESTTPDDDDVCSVPTLSPAELDVPAIGAQPATTIRYTWSDVRLAVTTAHAGNQMVANLRFSQDGCTADYHVLGLWPAVSCEELDAEGNGTGQPDPSRCDPDADPNAGRPTGSGINPDLKPVVACNPDLLLCTLTAPPGELR